MTRSSLAAISVVLITIVVGLVVYRWSGDEAPAVPPATELEREQKVVPGPAQGGSEVRVAAGPVVGPEQDGLRVLVMRRDRQPVAGATIEVIGEDRELRFSPTGDDGSTRALRLPNCDVYLRVRKDGLTGLAQWRWSTELVRELTIWMNPDRDVEVAVTDRAGARLAGTKVGLFAGEETDYRSSSTTGVADAEGVARIRVDGNTWLALHATVRAAVMGQGGTVASEPIAWAEPGPTRISLVLDRQASPPGPELRVRFVDAAGAPVAVDGRLSWSRITRAGAGSFEGPAGEMEVEGTEATVKSLLDGDELRLHLWETGRLESQLLVTLPSGARSQEVALARGAVAPRIEIPLVDAGGAPVKGGEFVVTLLAGFHYETESTLRTDSDGLIVLDLAETTGGKVEIAEKRDPARFHWPVRERLVRPYRTSVGEAPAPNPVFAVLEFPSVAPGDVRRLPPVVVDVVSPRIVGSVVDAGNRPVVGARIWMTTVTVPEPDAFANFATTTDAEGRFTILATSLPDEVYVCARQPLAFAAPLRVRPSSVPVTLRMQPTGAIAMDLRLPERPAMPEALANRLRLRMDVGIDEAALADGTWMFFRQRSTVFEGEYRKRWRAHVWVLQPGDCTFRDLVPGEYSVHGGIGTNGVFDLPGVRVLAGETVRPPSAQGITIGAGIGPECVRVRDAEGRPLAKVRVQLMLPEWRPVQQHPEWCNTDANGEAWFIVPRGGLADVELDAQGLAPVKLQGAAFPIEVMMGAGSSLDFAITGIREVAADSRAVVVGCMPFRDAPPESPIQQIAGMTMFRHPQANLDEAGHATIPNLPPGRYRLWLGVVPSRATKGGYTFVLLGDREINARDPARVAVEHAVTAAEAATLLGR